MKTLANITLIIFVVFLFSCKGKQLKDNKGSAATELIEEAYAEPTDDHSEIIELEVASPKPIDVEQLRQNLMSEYSSYSRVQQRLIADLLGLDNSSIKALGSAKDVLKKYFKNVTAKQCDSLYIAYSAYANLLLGYAMSDRYYTQIID